MNRKLNAGVMPLPDHGDSSVVGDQPLGATPSSEGSPDSPPTRDSVEEVPQPDMQDEREPDLITNFSETSGSLVVGEADGFEEGFFPPGDEGVQIDHIEPQAFYPDPDQDLTFSESAPDEMVTITVEEYQNLKRPCPRCEHRRNHNREYMREYRARQRD